MKNNSAKCSGPSCPRIGIKIHESDNEYRQDPFSNAENPITNKSSLKKPVDFHNTTLDTLDLELDHYSLEDLYRLFNIYDCVINEPNLKNRRESCVKTVGNPDSGIALSISAQWDSGFCGKWITKCPLNREISFIVPEGIREVRGWNLANMQKINNKIILYNLAFSMII